MLDMNSTLRYPEGGQRIFNRESTEPCGVEFYSFGELRPCGCESWLECASCGSPSCRTHLVDHMGHYCCKPCDKRLTAQNTTEPTCPF